MANEIYLYIWKGTKALCNIGQQPESIFRQRIKRKTEIILDIIEVSSALNMQIVLAFMSQRIWLPLLYITYQSCHPFSIWVLCSTQWVPVFHSAQCILINNSSETFMQYLYVDIWIDSQTSGCFRKHIVIWFDLITDWHHLHWSQSHTWILNSKYKN